MKKIYQKPEFKVIELKARQQLLAGSTLEFRTSNAEQIEEGEFD